MWHKFPNTALCIFIFSLFEVLPVALAACPPFNPVFPAPKNLTASPITDAVSLLQDTITELLANETVVAQLDLGNTSFSVDFYSLHGDGSSILTYHHSAPVLAEANSPVTNVTSDSQYRIGSISKLWTIYLWLIAADGDTAFNDPITKYVSELADYAKEHGSDPMSVDFVDWSDITVGALASHLAGIGRDAAPWPEADKLLQAALPGLPNGTYPKVNFCGDLSTDNSFRFPCERSDFFADFLFKDPVLPAFHSPVYTNNAFQILGYALENITNTSLPDLFQSYLVEAINLTASTYTVPSSNSSAIILVDGATSGYNYDLLGATPAGGYFSSINDARKVGLSILNSTFLSQAQTKRWLKPRSFTTSLGFAVGAPWEIERFPSASTQVSEQNISTHWLYTKEGDIGIYSTLQGLIPDLDVGFTVFSAGPATARVVSLAVADVVTEAMIPALDEAARLEADSVYGGTYTDEASNSSIVVTTNPGELGLAVTGFVFNGQDLLELLASAYIPPAAAGSANITVNLFPTGLMTKNDTGTVVGWRAVYGFEPEIETYPGLLSSQCWIWAGLDGPGYMGYSFDDIRATLSQDGTQAASITVRALGVTMSR